MPKTFILYHVKKKQIMKLYFRQEGFHSITYSPHCGYCRYLYCQGNEQTTAGIVVAAARPWLISNQPLPPHHLVLQSLKLPQSYIMTPVTGMICLPADWETRRNCSRGPRHWNRKSWNYQSNLNIMINSMICVIFCWFFRGLSTEGEKGDKAGE